MADISIALIKELREKTGAGMMDAKAALLENGGDIEASVDYLRKKGMAKADKKSSRTAAEGLVAVATNGTSGTVLEVNSETDFVARNDEFQSFVGDVVRTAQSHAEDLESLMAADIGGNSVADNLTALIAKIGEKMTVRRMAKLSVGKGVVAGYVHNPVAPNLGKIGTLVALESEGDAGKLEALGKQIAMHVAAAFPQYLDKESVDSSALEREKDVIREQARAEGKPDDIIEKMLEGRMRKFYEEICLLEQTFVVDGETKISKLLAAAEKDVGAPVKLTSFARFQLGEGIEKKTEDFASEVAAAVNG
ncbi:MAG: elongation factor Ts [Rhodospirillales bacterium]|nr:elongation factor Ts [Alphaproteobacteria bacterium]USO03294.1 MAG: elongation factor Ts [Rhodospirillales bacterium]